MPKPIKPAVWTQDNWKTPTLVAGATYTKVEWGDGTYNVRLTVDAYTKLKTTDFETAKIEAKALTIRALEQALAILKAE